MFIAELEKPTTIIDSAAIKMGKPPAATTRAQQAPASRDRAAIGTTDKLRQALARKIGTMENEKGAA